MNINELNNFCNTHIERIEEEAINTFIYSDKEKIEYDMNFITPLIEVLNSLENNSMHYFKCGGNVYHLNGSVMVRELPYSSYWEVMFKKVNKSIQIPENLYFDFDKLIHTPKKASIKDGDIVFLKKEAINKFTRLEDVVSYMMTGGWRVTREVESDESEFCFTDISYGIKNKVAQNVCIKSDKSIKKWVSPFDLYNELDDTQKKIVNKAFKAEENTFIP